MPKITNPVIIDKIRQGLLEGKPDNQVIMEAGLSKGTANHTAGRCKVLKAVKSGISIEIDKKGLVEKAYRVLERKLQSQRDSDSINAANIILKFTEGEIVKSQDITPEEKSILDKYIHSNRIGKDNVSTNKLK